MNVNDTPAQIQIGYWVSNKWHVHKNLNDNLVKSYNCEYYLISMEILKNIIY